VAKVTQVKKSKSKSKRMEFRDEAVRLYGRLTAALVMPFKHKWEIVDFLEDYDYELMVVGGEVEGKEWTLQQIRQAENWKLLLDSWRDKIHKFYGLSSAQLSEARRYAIEAIQVHHGDDLVFAWFTVSSEGEKQKVVSEVRSLLEKAEIPYELYVAWADYHVDYSGKRSEGYIQLTVPKVLADATRQLLKQVKGVEVTK